MKKVIAVALALSLSSCATSYQSRGTTGGYSETQLAPDIFKVRFSGNGYTRLERSQDFVSLRSAELTLNNNYKYYAVIDNRDHLNKSYDKTPDLYQINTYNNGFGTSTSTITNYGGDISETTSPKSEQLIKCFLDKPNNIYTYDAKFILKSIKDKYHIK